MLTKNKICLVIPVYNEAASIELSVKELLPDDNQYSLLFVDDGSCDTSYSLLKELKDKAGFGIIKHESNKGYGAACRSGAAWAVSGGFEWVIFADSDLTNPPHEIKSLAIRLMDSKFDVHKASRNRLSKFAVPNTSWRRTLSFIAKIFSRIFIGSQIQDPTNGFRAVRTNLYAAFDLKSNDFSIILEEVYAYIAHGAKVTNFQSDLGTRNQSQRSSSFNYDSKLLRQYIYWCIKCLLVRSYLGKRVKR
jgi:dolichol-phosphate mannosyltransferase